LDLETDPGRDVGVNRLTSITWPGACREILSLLLVLNCICQSGISPVWVAVVSFEVANGEDVRLLPINTLRGAQSQAPH
jgi:hypothetical protein